MCFIGMTVYKYFDIEYIGYKNKKLALYLVFVQTQTQKQAKVSLHTHPPEQSFQFALNIYLRTLFPSWQWASRSHRKSQFFFFFYLFFFCFKVQIKIWHCVKNYDRLSLQKNNDAKEQWISKSRVYSCKIGNKRIITDRKKNLPKLRRRRRRKKKKKYTDMCANMGQLQAKNETASQTRWFFFFFF